MHDSAIKGFRELKRANRTTNFVNDNDIIRTSLERPEAFAEIYDLYATRIYRYAAGRVGADRADDILSETFLVAFDRRHQFDLTSTSAGPWLFGIVVTLLKRHARIEARAFRGLLADHAAWVEPGVIDAVGSRIDAEREIQALAGSLKRLRRGDRDVLLLHAWTDLDYQGIADSLGIPIGTVRSRLNRARRQLRVDNPQEVDHGSTRTSPQGA